MRGGKRLSIPVILGVVAAACAVAVVVGVLPATRPQPAPSATLSPIPSSPETLAPSAPPSAQPSATSAPTPAPAPTPAATPTILMLPPDAPPEILWYHVSSTTPRAGDTVIGTVLTSSNVASVELRIGTYSINLPKTDVGHFEGSYLVPHLPFFINHNLTMLIIARNTAGEAAEGSLALQIR